MVSALYLILTHKLVAIEPTATLWANSKEVHHNQDLLNIGISRKEEASDWALLDFDFSQMIELDQRPRKFTLKLWFTPDSHIEPGESVEVFLGTVSNTADSLKELEESRNSLFPPSPPICEIRELRVISPGKPTLVELEMGFFLTIYNILLDSTNCFGTEPNKWNGKISLGIAAKEGSSTKTNCKIYSQTAESQYNPKIEALVKLAKGSPRQ